jgi:hypothetical protein
VEGVGAGLDRNADDAAAGATVLRVVRVGLDLELLSGLDRRDVGHGRARANADVIGDAVDLKLVDAAAAAVNGHVGAGADVEGPGELEAAGELHARGQAHQHEGILAADGQVGDVAVLDDLAAAGGGGFQQRRLGGDGDPLGELPDLEAHVQPQAVIHAQLDGRALEALEARLPDFEAVAAWQQEGDHVVARRIAFRPRRRRGWSP